MLLRDLVRLLVREKLLKGEVETLGVTARTVQTSMERGGDVGPRAYSVEAARRERIDALERRILTCGIWWNWRMPEPRLGFRGTKPNTLGAGDAKAFHPLSCSAIMESVSGFSSCFLPRNLEGSHPRIRVRLHRIEHCALRTAAQGIRTGGIEHCALPTLHPGGTHSQRLKRIVLRPLGHLGRGVSSAPPMHPHCGTTLTLLGRSLHTPHLATTA